MAGTRTPPELTGQERAGLAALAVTGGLFVAVAAALVATVAADQVGGWSLAAGCVGLLVGALAAYPLALREARSWARARPERP